jgi:hypothetical protein
MLRLYAAIYKFVEASRPIDVRSVNYHLANVLGLIEKTEAEFKNVAVRLLGKMRRPWRHPDVPPEYIVPMDWIVDPGQGRIEPNTADGVCARLLKAKDFPCSRWSELNVPWVEVFVEKHGLADVFMPVTIPFGIPLNAAGGYSSISLLNESAEAIKAADERGTVVYLLSDYDPDGRLIAEEIEHELRDYSGVADIRFETVGLTREQVDTWGLPTRPTKRATGKTPGPLASRQARIDAHNDHRSVDLNAATVRLRDLLRTGIETHLDAGARRKLAAIKRREAGERKQIDQILHAWREGWRP